MDNRAVRSARTYQARKVRRGPTAALGRAVDEHPLRGAIFRFAISATGELPGPSLASSLPLPGQWPMMRPEAVTDATRAL
eukprot:1451497-Prymnesium_polylepis.1